MSIPLLTAAETAGWDQATIRSEPIASIDLMERASRVFTEWFRERVRPDEPVTVLHGPGNNGGDGLAIARMLRERGHAVSCFGPSSGLSEDAATNLARLGSTDVAHAPIDAFAPTPGDVVVDALFGSGLDRPIEGRWADLIERTRSTGVRSFAVDVPSGLCMDRFLDGPVLPAEATLSFEVPKRVFLHPSTGALAGDWSARSIGLAPDHPMPVRAALTTDGDVRRLHRPRQRFTHKGSHGHGLLAAGSKGSAGAAVLAARAALSAGAGKLTVHTPISALVVLQTAVPEAMVRTDANALEISDLADLSSFDALAMGPGMDTHDAVRDAVLTALDRWEGPLVLDADALNIVAANDAIDRIPPNALLTPHPGELRRLVGPWRNDFEKEDMVLDLARRIDGHVLLKGAWSVLATADGRLLYNCTGHPALATAGTGDVLTGILLALLCQGHDAVDAARIGSWLHGRAADIFVERTGSDRMRAGQVIDELPAAIADWRGQRA